VTRSCIGRGIDASVRRLERKTAGNERQYGPNNENQQKASEEVAVDQIKNENRLRGLAQASSQRVSAGGVTGWSSRPVQLKAAKMASRGLFAGTGFLCRLRGEGRGCIVGPVAVSNCC